MKDDSQDSRLSDPALGDAANRNLEGTFRRTREDVQRFIIDGADTSLARDIPGLAAEQPGVGRGVRPLRGGAVSPAQTKEDVRRFIGDWRGAA